MKGYITHYQINIGFNSPKKSEKNVLYIVNNPSTVDNYHVWPLEGDKDQHTESQYSFYSFIYLFNFKYGVLTTFVFFFLN